MRVEQQIRFACAVEQKVQQLVDELAVLRKAVVHIQCAALHFGIQFGDLPRQLVGCLAEGCVKARCLPLRGVVLQQLG